MENLVKKWDPSRAEQGYHSVTTEEVAALGYDNLVFAFLIPSFGIVLSGIAFLVESVVANRRKGSAFEKQHVC